ncbi:MAG: aliphatic sulfonate ABC transporter substrate-binding protein [Caldilineaceae bacterium]|nr:aliphatic sulfonate ABC transporter substrate-binding protein [Caldilineaceae bacterium]
MKIFCRLCILGCLLTALTLCAGCGGSSSADKSEEASVQAASGPNLGADVNGRTIVIGYSDWPGWWPWYVAEQEGLFEQHGLDVELRWFEDYHDSLRALAAGEIDGNAQTLDDTVAFAPTAVNGEVAVLVNDNSMGDDKIVVAAEVQSLPDLAGKKIGLEGGAAEDFLLTLALYEAGLRHDDVEIVNMETSAGIKAFVAGELDGIGTFPPYGLKALARAGSHELVTSAHYPGAFPDLLVVSQTLVDQRPDDVQKLVEVWFDVIGFMKVNLKEAEDLMADRAGISVEEVEVFEEGVRIFSVKDNVDAFAPEQGMAHLPFAAQQIAHFLVEIGSMPTAPTDFNALFDGRFVQAYSDSLAH